MLPSSQNITRSLTTPDQVEYLGIMEYITHILIVHYLRVSMSIKSLVQKSIFLLLLSLLLILLAGCDSETSSVSIEKDASQLATPTLTYTLVPSATPQIPASQSKCDLDPIIAPTMPAEIPDYTHIDPDTNLHMTGSVQEFDLESYRLEITGKVETPLSLTLEDLRCMPKIETDNPLECPGFFIDHAEWAGAPLARVMEMAGIQDGAEKITMISADGYERSLDLNIALRPINFLAYEWNGEPLPILHGFPVRAIFPEEYGGVWAKWLIRIEVE
jgi:DMSO/TMAO reductase YedYZ molybdopterin-dependent catalytic subunit